VVVGTAENDVTGAKRIATFRRIVKPSDSNHGSSEPDCGNGVTNHVDLEAPRDSVSARREVKSVEIRFVYPIAINKHQPRYSDPGQ